MKNKVGLLVCLLLLCTLDVVSADYKVVYRNSDGRIIYAATTESEFPVAAGHTLSPTQAGDIPGWITPHSDWNGGSPVDRGKWFHLYVTTSDETITANGTSTANINIQKRKWDGTDMVGVGDSEVITLQTTRGLLSAASGALVKGTLNVSLTSVSESVTATVSGTADNLDRGSVAVGFVP